MSRLTELRDVIREHNVAYYRNDAPTITDAAYDTLLSELLALETTLGVTSDTASLSGSVGTPVGLGKVHTHKSKMLSLANAFDTETIAKFMDGVSTKLTIGATTYCMEPKIDGLAINLHYVRGELLLATTRGDGTAGEDVTANVKSIFGIPHNLSAEGVVIPDELEVRGEIYLPKRELVAINLLRSASGEKLFVNARNAAAGTLRQSDPTLCKTRGLSLYVYGAGINGNLLAGTHSDVLSVLEQLGFSTTPGWLVSNIHEVGTQLASWADKRSILAYDIDGVVLKVNDLSQQVQIGAGRRYPHWAIAYKFPAEEGVSVVTAIVWQVGRMGVLTPVAHINPLVVGGATVSRVTLHNLSEIHNKDIRINDKVVVRRAGDVIPEIVRVHTGATPREPVVKVLTNCPVCGGGVEFNGVATYCKDSTSCPGQLKGRISHFVSKKCFDIDGFGDKLVDSLVAGNVLKDTVGVHRLTVKALEPFVGTKRAVKIHRCLLASKEISLPRFLYSLGIPHIGRSVSEALADKYGTVAGVICASKESVLAIPGTGDTIATNLVTYLQPSGDGINTISELLGNGITIKIPETTVGILSGEVMVITGTHPELSRTEIAARLVALGGVMANSVSRRVTTLVVGANPGGKVAKAKKLGITITTIDDMLAKQ
ncbi:MAG: NAD-dependent DNA ligase LigA [Mariprofundaceae bacterium]|nr:NAD-dependent DNA ligase LigA [Mariprofundaceae bacterium]